MKDYPKPPSVIAQGSTVLSTCSLPKLVDVPCEHIGACIVVHGVNDVGVSFQAVEEGLCEGIAERMAWCPGQPNHASPYTPAGYRLPTDDDRTRLEDDPDAVFFKRHVGTTTHSPVIPFYWGYRVSADERTRRRNGQWVDEADNRLDKDLSKGGGPFANATTNLADMWKSGAPAFGGFIDWLSGDPLRPVLEAGAVVVGRHAVAGGRVGGGMVGPARAPRHALGDALTEAFLDGLEAHPDVVDPMHDDAGPHVFAGDVDEPGQRTGAEHGAALGDDLWRLGVVLHGAARGGRRCRSGYCLIIHVRAWWGVVKAMKNYGVAMGWGVGGRSSPVGPGVLRALGVAASCAVCGCVRRG